MSGQRRQNNSGRQRQRSQQPTSGPSSSGSTSSEARTSGERSSGQRPTGQRSSGPRASGEQQQKAGPNRGQQQRSQRSGGRQKNHKQTSHRESTPKKKKINIFDLKFDATETIDIPTSPKIFRLPAQPQQVKPDAKRYGILFFETFAEANQQLGNIEQNAKTYDQLNIVVHQEGPMYNTTLNQFGKVFAGEAWWTVHKRRDADGWYQPKG